MTANKMEDPTRNSKGMKALPLSLIDGLAIISAAYSFSSTLKQWITELLRVTDRSMGVGLPGFACVFQAANGTISIERTSAAALRLAPDSLRSIFDSITSGRPAWVRSCCAGGRPSRVLLTTGIGWVSQSRRRAKLSAAVMRNSLNIICIDVDDIGVLISLARPTGATIPQGARRALISLAGHIIPGRRLRDHFNAPGRPLPVTAATAFPPPKDRALQGDGEPTLARARQNLQLAARDIERAGATLRDGTGRILRPLGGVASANCFLVDHFESDGKRFIVALENAPLTSTLSALSPAERTVVAHAARGLSTKEVGYALGITDSTVRVLIMRAARRCGVKTRGDLFKLAEPKEASPLGH
jgi:DNA-binding CsgD family transcriptional regulator